MNVLALYRQLNVMTFHMYGRKILLNASKIYKYPMVYISSSLAGHVRSFNQIPSTRTRICSFNILVRHEHSDKVEQNPICFTTLTFPCRLVISILFGFEEVNYFEEAFPLGAKTTIKYVTRHIRKGNIDGLRDILTKDALSNAEKYVRHSMKGNQNMYNMEENYIEHVYIKCRRFERKQRKNRDVIVLTMIVIFEKVDINKHTGFFRRVRDYFLYNPMAVFEFQRLYDESYEHAISDWTVSSIKYTRWYYFDIVDEK